MSKENVIELSDRFGIEVFLCSNAETVCDGHNIDDCHQNDATSLIVRAMRDAVWGETGKLVDYSRNFRDWHGKRWDRDSRNVACRTLTRAVTLDEDGEEEFGNWKWIRFQDMPKEIQDRIDKILDVASDAGDEALLEAERQFGVETE